MSVTTIVIMILTAILGGLVAQILSNIEMRRISKGANVRYDGPLIEWLSVSIIFLCSLFFQVCMLQSSLTGIVTAGLFGAFLSTAALSDAKTGWVPDSVIIPALVTGALYAWRWHTGTEPDLMKTLIIVLICLGVFAALVITFLLTPFIRFTPTPPDLVFAILIVATPHDIPQMLIVLLVLCAGLLLVKKRPEWVRALIPSDERSRITKQMEEVLGHEEGHMEKQGWYPLGPIALFCVMAGVCANALL